MVSEASREREREREREAGDERDVAALCDFGKGGILGREKNTCTPTGMAHFQLPSEILVITKIKTSK
ncbi:hypothetical protein RHMOL_Rhmol03G0087000 [Rhododendron molle]|uniref:Uncharacterized protein n=2 Tax=Rhododendron molle TaxID=49168 RepID=A0ACC0PC08_RHOML|nr:hypothetical protein RHMOL_Rhmol03G0086900 [Rhododendron molle]KAI8563096.1 hypothetical protein RHMOL_Rhmol03G0087000 [Rhododendron molle]